MPHNKVIVYWRIALSSASFFLSVDILAVETASFCQYTLAPVSFMRSCAALLAIVLEAIEEQNDEVYVEVEALINKDVPAYALMVGVPARQIGWMSEYWEKLDLPLSGNVNVTCERTGQKYQLKDGQVSVIGC